MAKLLTPDLRDKLVEHYEKALEMLKGEKSVDKRYAIILEMNICYGVCYCSQHEFGVTIYYCEIIRNLKSGGRQYWCDYPFVNNFIEPLQTRINILKSIQF